MVWSSDNNSINVLVLKEFGIMTVLLGSLHRLAAGAHVILRCSDAHVCPNIKKVTDTGQ